MRYRPFGRSGNAVSAVTLNLGDATLARGKSGARDLLVSAMEHGVNTFHMECADPVLAELAGTALAAVDRRLVFLTVRVGQRIERGRKVRKNLKVGICGEHGGDPASVAFCHEVGLDYVSCSPFRVPIARLAAAQAALGQKAAGEA